MGDERLSKNGPATEATEKEKLHGEAVLTNFVLKIIENYFSEHESQELSGGPLDQLKTTIAKWLAVASIKSIGDPLKTLEKHIKDSIAEIKDDEYVVASVDGTLKVSDLGVLRRIIEEDIDNL